MLSPYSKLIASLVGAALGAAVSFGVLPEQLATPEIQTALVALISAVCVYLAPANKA